MATNLTTLTPYCSASDFLTRFDWRPIAQLMNDDNSASVTRANLLDSGTTEGGRLLEILLESSGEVEAAALLGQRYTPTVLSALTGASAAFLKRIVADIAIGRCYERRPGLNPWAQQTQTARGLLNALGSGERIFGTEEAAAASVLSTEVEPAYRVTDRNGMVVQMEGFFGVRGNRSDPFR